MKKYVISISAIFLFLFICPIISPSEKTTSNLDSIPKKVESNSPKNSFINYPPYLSKIFYLEATIDGKTSEWRMIVSLNIHGTT